MLSPVKKLRCQRCSKWKPAGSLSTLPEELYYLLEAENEFGVCEDCIDRYSLDNWKQWILIARTEGKSYKSD